MVLVSFFCRFAFGKFLAIFGGQETKHETSSWPDCGAGCLNPNDPMEMSKKYLKPTTINHNNQQPMEISLLNLKKQNNQPKHIQATKWIPHRRSNAIRYDVGHHLHPSSRSLMDTRLAHHPNRRGITTPRSERHHWSFLNSRHYERKPKDIHRPCQRRWWSWSL